MGTVDAVFLVFEIPYLFYIISMNTINSSLLKLYILLGEFLSGKIYVFDYKKFTYIL